MSASKVGREITYVVTLENLGEVELSELAVSDDLDTVFGAGNYSISVGPQLVSNPGTLYLNRSFDGSSDPALLDTSNPGTLAVGAVASIRFSVEVTTAADMGNGLGVYTSQVTATAQGPDSSPTSDLSDNGTDPDPNANGDPTEAGEDDATVISLTENPELKSAKNATVSGSQVTFDVYLANSGNATLSGIAVTDDLDAVFGAGNYSVASAPTLLDDPGTLVVNAGFDGSADVDLVDSGTLAVDDTARIRFVVDVATLSDRGSGLGVYSNQVSASASGPTGSTTSDLSDNGTDPAAGTNAPTAFAIGEEPAVGVAKSASVSGSAVTFDLYLENLGNTALSGLTLEEDLDAVFGAGNYSISSAPQFVDDPGTLVLAEGFDGSGTVGIIDSGTLAIGDTAQIRLVVSVSRLADGGSGLGVYQNQVTVSAEGPSGGVVSDLSDDGSDPDPNGNGAADDSGEDDATAFTVAPTPLLGVAMEGRYIGTTASGTYKVNGVNQSVSAPEVELYYTLGNYGNVVLDQLSLSDDLDAVFGNGNFGVPRSNISLITGEDPGTVNLNASFDGRPAGDTAILAAGSSLAPGDTVTIRIKVALVTASDQGYGVGVYHDSVSASGDSPADVTVNDDSVDGLEPDANDNGDPTDDGGDSVIYLSQAIGAAKTATVNGNQVTFDIYLENLGSVGLTEVALTDGLDGVFGSGAYSISSAPVLVDDPGTLTLNSGYDGSSDTGLLDSASSSLVAGDTAHITFTVAVALLGDRGNGLGVYSNQALVAGVGPSGDTILDYSDAGTDPDPSGDGNPKGSGEDDATGFTVASDALVGAALNATVSGTAITFDIYLENFGTGTATNLTLTDDLDGVFGAGNYAITSAPAWVDDPGTLTLNAAYDGSDDTDLLDSGGTLAAGDTAQIRVVVEVLTESDQGLGSGMYESQVTVAGYDSRSVYTEDLSDWGTDPDPGGDGNPTSSGEDDATQFFLGDAAIGIALTTRVSGAQVTFEVTIENLGKAVLSNVFMEFPLNPIFGSGTYSVLNQPALVDGASTLTLSPQFFGFNIFSRVVVGGTLLSGEYATFRFTINVNSGTGPYSGQMTVTAQDPLGNTVSDDSDNGLDPDPDGDGNADEDGENDATPITLNETVSIGIAEDASVAGSVVTLDFYLENLGNAALNDIAFSDDLDAVFGAGNYAVTSVPAFVDDPGTLTLDGSYDGSGNTALLVAASSSLAAGDTAQIRMQVTVSDITDRGLGLGGYQDQVTVSAAAASGTMFRDVSDSGTDPDPSGDGYADGSGESDVTTFTLTEPAVGLATRVTVLGGKITIDYFIENLGNATLINLSLTDDLDGVFGADNYAIVEPAALAGEQHGLLPNEAFDGSADPELIASGSILAGTTEQIRVVLRVTNPTDRGSGLGVYANQASVSAEDANGGSVSDLSDDGTNPDSDGDSVADEAGENDPSQFALRPPELGNLGDTRTYGHKGAAVVIDPDATISDEELEDADSFDGATLSIERQGGADAGDVFGNSGRLGSLTEGGDLTLDGTVIGTVTTNSGGTLLLTFNATATAAYADETLQSITYYNSTGGAAGTLTFTITYSNGNDTTTSTKTIDVVVPIWSGTGDWTTDGNWNAGTPPIAAQDVIIDTGSNVNVGSDVQVGSMTSRSGARVVLGAGRTLTVTGDYVQDDGGFTFGDGARVVIYGTVKNASGTRLSTGGNAIILHSNISVP